ncbi:MAG: DeoR/GlpR transcriptional regulator [Acholeplasmataceae bacterium]|nr:DeoR/GlpR transcriptional regulator [Acholeplasmataceae bacterium]
MILNDRQRKIFEILKKEKTINTRELMNRLFVSESTLRRDLSFLAKQGIIYRTHGSAIFAESSSMESSIHVRVQSQVKEKGLIALKCLEYINKNESYFIDSSSTVGYVLPFLDNYQNITVITNGLNNASILTQKTNVKVYLTGGIVYRNTNSILGIDTINYVKRFNCNVFIFSCGGISVESGISEANLEQALVKQEMLNHSKIHILLADHKKFGVTNLCQSCDFKDIDFVITDKMPSAEFIQIFDQNDVKLVIA